MKSKTTNFSIKWNLVNISIVEQNEVSSNKQKSIRTIELAKHPKQLLWEIKFHNYEKFSHVYFIVTDIQWSCSITEHFWQRSTYQIQATPQSGVLYDNETELEWQGTVNCQNKLIYSNPSEYLENLLNDARNQQ